MKKIILIVVGCFLIYNASAQDKEDKLKTNKGKLQRTDRIVIDIFSDIWMNAPTDSMKIKQINRGANAYFMFEFPFGKSNFSFAPGIGIGFTNLYSTAMPVKSFAFDSLGAKVYDGNTVFKKVPSFSPDGQQAINVKNNKFSIVSADIPLEFRYRTRNSAFKFYVGAKVGITLSNYMKYNGDNFNENSPTGTIRFKEYKIANVASYRYGITCRIGWKWVQAYGYYSLSKFYSFERSEKKTYFFHVTS